MNMLNSFLKKKCPHCRQGDLFTKPFRLSDPLSMDDNCKVCNQAFEPEPGFYFGAMFMTYIVTGFLYLFIVGSLIYFAKLSVNQAMLILLIFCGLTYIQTMRLGRSLWIHMMVKYKP